MPAHPCLEVDLLHATGQVVVDLDAVVETVQNAGIASKVARLRPVAVIKG